MRLHAARRWLLGCALGTTCFLGTVVAASQLGLNSARGNPGLGLELSPAYPEVFHAAPPATASTLPASPCLSPTEAAKVEPAPQEEVIFLNRSATPPAAATGNPPPLGFRPTDTVLLSRAAPLPRAWLGFAVAELPP